MIQKYPKGVAEAQAAINHLACLEQFYDSYNHPELHPEVAKALAVIRADLKEHQKHLGFSLGA